jgi:hypothetical protein
MYKCTVCDSKTSIKMLLSFIQLIPSDQLLTAKNQYRKLETNITRKVIVWPQSKFPHSCVCERFIYFHDRSAYSVAGNMCTDPVNI